MMSLPPQVKTGVENLLQEVMECDVKLREFSAVGGGCINHGGKLATTNGDFFIKWNDAKKFQGMFQAEASGLKQLAEPGAVRIPDVVSFGENNGYQFLVLEFIEGKKRSSQYWNLLGTQLASLHQNSRIAYGLDHNNFMGSLSQQNDTTDSWVDFFVEKRLDIQLKLGVDNHNIPMNIAKKLNALYGKLPSILVTDKPALVHGDLWSGNLMTDEKGSPCLIDPAVYYGHREIDLAMTQLFGGFDPEFYSTYQEVYPCEPGLQERLDIYNLYPLLVHVNLFGQSYLHQVNSILSAFTR